MAGVERSVKVRLEANVSDFVTNVGVKAVGAANKLGDAVEKASAKVDKATARTDTSGRRLSESITANANKASEAVKKNSAHIDRIGDASTKVGIAAAAGLGLAAKAAIDWESAWAGVAKTVNASDSELADLEGQLRGMAKTLPASHADIAAVAEAAGQLGVKTKDIASFTKVMVDLGETTNLTSDEAATSLAQFMNVLQTAPQDVGRLGAAVVALGNDGASTERDIVSMAQRISSTGAIVGLSEQQVLAYAAALANVGIEAEAGGSAISSVFVKIDKAVSEGGDTLDLFAQLAGTTSTDFAKRFETDASGATQAFIEGLGRMNKAGGDVNGTMETLGITEIRQRNAVLSLAASGDNLSNSLKTSNKGWKDNTALVNEAAKRYATTESQIRIAWNQIKDAAITAGAEILPVVRDIAAGVANVAEVFGNLPGPVRTVVVGLGTFVAVAALAAGGAAKTVTTVVELRTAMAALGATTGRTNAALSLMGKGGIAVGAAIGVGFLADAIEDAAGASSKMDLSGLSGDMLRLGETGKVTGQLAKNFGDDLGGVSRKVISDGHSLAEALKEATSGNDNFLERTQHATPGFGQWVDRIHEMDQALAQLVQGGNADSASKAYERIEKTAKDAGISVDMLKKAFPEYASAVESAGVDTQIAGKKAATTAKSNVTLDDSLNGVTVSAEDAADAIDKYVDALFAMPNLVLGVRDAQRGVQAAIDDATAAYKENGRTLNIHTAEGRANQAALDAVAQRTNTASEALYRANASQKTLNATAKEGREALIQVAIRMGMGRKAAEKYAEGIIKVPTSRHTQFTNNAGPEKKPARDVNLLTDRYKDFPRNVHTKVTNDAGGKPKTAAQQYADLLLGKNRAGVPKDVVTEVNTKTATARKDIASFVAEVNRSLNGIGDETVNVSLAFAESGAGHAPKDASGRSKHWDGGPIGGYSPTPTADNIPIMATAGEHMWTVAETNAVGGHGAMVRLRDAAMRGELRGFAAGGAIAHEDVGIGLGASGRAATAAAIQRTVNTRIAAFANEIAKEAFAGGGGPAGPPGSVHPFRGERLNERTIAMLLSAERILGATFNIMQGSYSTRVAASGSTHAGGGVMDTDGPRGWDLAVRALRAAGFAAWHRTPAQGPWGHHIHSVAKGDPTESTAAKAQVRDFLRGGDGLAGGYSRGVSKSASATPQRAGGRDLLATGGPVKRPPLLTAIDPNRYARMPRYAGGGGVGSSSSGNPVLRRDDLKGLRLTLDAGSVGTLTGHIRGVASDVVETYEDFNRRTGGR